MNPGRIKSNSCGGVFAAREKEIGSGRETIDVDLEVASGMDTSKWKNVKNLIGSVEQGDTDRKPKRISF
jgi:hypothetical protein